MTKPTAKIIADSVSEAGVRLTTMEVTMHRFVLAEFNTHRMFSRNSASSRAIPYHKIRNRVVDDPAFPVKWASEQKGMQGGDELTEEFLNLSKSTWLVARDKAIDGADLLNEFGLHKSLVNRLIEPFTWHTVIVTATEWDNFFHQRCHPDAQPEMKAAADAMQLAYYSVDPRQYRPYCHGTWHVPYTDEQTVNDIKARFDMDNHLTHLEYLKKISVARCARVSYLTQDGVRDIQADLELFDRLKGSGHWSPFEHVATPIQATQWSGNFRGWRQFRKEFQGENRQNFVPNLEELAHVRMKMEKEAGVPYVGDSYPNPID